MSFKDRMTRAEDYVFGLMDEHERQRAERDMEIDPEFRDCVMMLAERLRKLHRAKGSAPISEDAWDEITTRIATLPQMGGNEAAARLAALGIPSPDPERKGFLQVRRPMAHQFAGWRGIVVAATLAAAMGVGYLAGQGFAPVPQPQTITLLGDSGSAPAAILETYGNGTLRIVPLRPVDVPDGKALRLWTWQGDTAVPLGTVEAAGGVLRPAVSLSKPEAGQRFTLTVEAADTSDTVPTGETLLSGEAVTPY